MDYATKVSIHIDDEDDEEEEVCRICRNPGDADNPLRYPCACSGSIKFVHEDCLLQWLSFSKARHCEVCKHSFAFSPLYAENAPTRLPFHEFVVGVAMKACNSRLPRLSFVLCVWLLTVPFVTFWMWRLSFLRFFGEEAQRLFLSHVSTTVVLIDSLLGFILSASIMFVLREAASFRDYFRHLRVSLYELVGLEGPLFRLVENAFSVLASNMLFIGGVIFVPFTLGRVILYHFADTGLSLRNILTLSLNNVLTAAVSSLINNGQLTEMVKVNGSELSGAIDTLFVAAAGLSSTLYDVTTLTVGYMFIVSLVLLYLGITALIRYFKDEPLTVEGVYGIAWIVETVSPLLGQFLVVMTLGIRLVSFVVVIFGVFPLMCGWWLDVCTVTMFGQTMSYRLQFLSVSPLASSLVHWVVGAVYDWYSLILENLLRQVLRPEVLYFLYGPEDDEEEETIRYLIHDPVHKIARDGFLSGAQYGSWIVLLVFLPVKLAIWMAPSVFPLDISVSDPYTEIPAGILLLTICTPFIIEHFKDNAGQEQENGEPGRQNRAIAALPAADDPNRSLLQEYNLQLRITLLLLVASVTLLLVHSTLIVAPVSLGRALFNAIPVLPIRHGIKCSDLYAFFTGTYVIWTTISGARYAMEHVKSERTSVLLNRIWKWCGIVIKSSVLLGIWVLIIPVLIGLLFELLVIVPIKVPVDESPVFILYQDWALGLIILKIWTRLMVDDSWRAKFERVKEDGFSRLQGLWVLREIVLPVVMKLVTALCVPHVLARGVFPMLGCPLVVNSAVYRFAWIGCLSASLLCFCAKRCHVWFRNLHNSIRDDRYIIGQRLHNSGEEAALAVKESQSS
uniref:RING-CH-type domain-containing protein n=1 Tax=Brassica campestris TaxID=3711 RepID=M4DM94_BRACM